jgi:hypothetical protein
MTIRMDLPFNTATPVLQLIPQLIKNGISRDVSGPVSSRRRLHLEYLKLIVSSTNNLLYRV